MGLILTMGDIFISTSCAIFCLLAGYKKVEEIRIKGIMAIFLFPNSDSDGKNPQS